VEGGTSGSRRSFGGAAAGRVAALLTLSAALVAVAAPSAAPQARVAVFFLQGEQLVQVSRPGSVQSLQRKWLSANLQRLPVLK
jgi:hypothetical protein